MFFDVKRNDETLHSVSSFMDFHSNKRAVYKTCYHIVFCTKYRKKIINGKMLLDIRNIFNAILTKNGIELIEFEGEKDHIHFLIDYPPAVNLTKIINVLKTVSSRKIRIKYDLQKTFYSKKGLLESKLFYNKRWRSLT